MANVLEANELRKGVVFNDNGDTWKVIDYKHIKVARGGATVRVKVQNLTSGVITEKTYNSDNKVEEADVAKRTCQFLYSDDSQSFFMDSSDFSQFTFDVQEVSEQIKYLSEGDKVIVLFLDSNPISIEIAKAVELEVMEAPEAVAGDTATSATKKAKLANGLEVDVPLFIKQGDLLKINTENGSYAGRVNN